MNTKQNYSDFKKNLMKNIKGKDDSETIDETSTNIKIENYLKAIAKSEAKQNALQNEIQYYHQISAWLDGIIISLKAKEVQGLKSSLSTTSNLTLLEKEAILGHKKRTIETKKINEEKQENKCTVEAHLRYILGKNKDKENEIEELMKKREELYERIKRSLIEEEPYLHDKIMVKIKREVQREVKLEGIRELENICKEKQKWLADSKSEIAHKVDEKLIEQKVTNNLQKMKELMLKKINNDEYMMSVSGNSNTIDKNIEKLNKLGYDIQALINGQIDKIENKAVEEELKEIENSKMLKNNVNFDEEFLDELNEYITISQEILSMPLQTEKSEQLFERCEELKQVIMETNRKY